MAYIVTSPDGVVRYLFSRTDTVDHSVLGAQLGEFYSVHEIAPGMIPENIIAGVYTYSPESQTFSPVA